MLNKLPLNFTAFRLIKLTFLNQILRNRHIGYIAVIIFCIAMYLTQRINYNKSKQNDQNKPIKQNHSTRNNICFKDFTIYKYCGGKKTVSIFGKWLGVEDKKLTLFNIAFIKVFKIKYPLITIFDNNKPVTTITAKTAVLGDVKKNIDILNSTLDEKIEFSGKIKVASATGNTNILTCEKMIWNTKNGIFFCKGNCVLQKNDTCLKLKSLKTNIKLDLLK